MSISVGNLVSGLRWISLNSTFNVRPTNFFHLVEGFFCRKFTSVYRWAKQDNAVREELQDTRILCPCSMIMPHFFSIFTTVLRFTVKKFERFVIDTLDSKKIFFNIFPNDSLLLHVSRKKYVRCSYAYMNACMYVCMYVCMYFTGKRSIVKAHPTGRFCLSSRQSITVIRRHFGV